MLVACRWPIWSQTVRSQSLGWRGKYNTYVSGENRSLSDEDDVLSAEFLLELTLQKQETVGMAEPADRSGQQLTVRRS